MICMLEDLFRRDSIFLSRLPDSYIPWMMSPSDCSRVLLSFEKFFIMMHISQSCCIHLSSLISQYSGDRVGVLFVCVFPLMVANTQFLSCTSQSSHFIPTLYLFNISAFEIGSYIQGAVWAECLEWIGVGFASLCLFLQVIGVVS